MSIRWACYLACTNCNDQFISKTGDSYAEAEEEILDRARLEGWGRWKVRNGNMWDFCPRCKKDA